MTNEELQKAIEVAEESVEGFAEEDSFEMLLAKAVLELKGRLSNERESVANWLMRKGFATGHGDTIVDMIDELEWQVVEKERDKFLSALRAFHDSISLVSSSNNIRARGQE
jgi:SOS response regulatory protein OraA/RecX